jgi:2-polyprenyl-3-methyl-5-hydroxy-6-metoxy-1,4-benzoquinol methylase
LSINSHEVSNQYYDLQNLEHRWRIQSILLKVARGRWRWLQEKIPPSTGRLLEIGCGTGEFLAVVRDDGWNVSGLELSKSFRDAAKSWYDLDLHAEELSEAGFAPQSFDVVVLLHVFEHLPNPLEFLDQISDILKPGGWLFFVVPNLSSWTDRLFGKSSPTLVKPDHFFHYTPRTLKQTLGISNFALTEMVTLEPKHHVWTSLYGFWSSKFKSSGEESTISQRGSYSSEISKIKAKLPYWAGDFTSIFLFPWRLWLHKMDRGHEIYALCRGQL